MLNHIEIENATGGLCIFYNDGDHRVIMGMIESIKMYSDKGGEKTQIVFHGHPKMIGDREKIEELVAKSSPTV